MYMTLMHTHTHLPWFTADRNMSEIERQKLALREKEKGNEVMVCTFTKVKELA